MAETKTAPAAPKSIEDIVKAHLKAGETIVAVNEKTRRVVTSGGRRFSVGADSATLESQSLEHA